MSYPPYSKKQSLPQIQLQMQAQSQTHSGLKYHKAPEGIPDQVYSSDGVIKPEWRYLLDSFDNLGEKALRDRQVKSRRILRDDGVTYNIYDERPQSDHRWELDLVPSIIGSEDWASIESGLLERAELFNLILRDLYGPRDLLRHNVFPGEALFGHGGFLRSCQGIQIPGEHELILHSADMIQRDDNSVCILSDRTQAPSGAGYVLENRTVMSRVFPSLFRDSHVHRLATFFQRLRHKLISLSPSDSEARVVVLTPGVQNETYFEHSYISNYLGFPLVQSGDLVVRNGFVWMKSLDGLSRVDVILRRVDDVYCDPVELRADSQLGVPGLLNVVRAGRVVMANPLGSGVLENPILLKYLPEISKRILGRELRLDSVKTYWCGCPDDLKFILSNLTQLIVKPIYRGSGLQSVWGGDLDERQLKELKLKIQANPLQFVAQERIEKSHIPTLGQNGLEARPSILRTFSVAADNSYTVMPGGLTRVGLSVGQHQISMQSGCPSKDTWVTATEPERITDNSVIDAMQSEPDDSSASLPSRVVENLFWLGRYAERAEASLRLLRTAFMLINGEETISKASQKILLCSLTEATGTHPGFYEASEEQLANPESELLDIINNGSRVGSIKSTLNSLLYCADQSKDLLSSDTFRVINDIRDALDSLNEALSNGLSSAPEEALDPLVIPLIALSGLMQESMVRGIAWHFMDMGRRVERATQILNTIKTFTVPVMGSSDTQTLLHAMLRSMEVLITYRRYSRAKRGLELGLELVMLDSRNPRSLIFQFEQLQHHFAHLKSDDSSSRELAEENRVLLEAVTSIKLSRISQLVEVCGGERERLSTLLDRLKHLLSDFSSVMSDRHFDHRIDPKQLVTTYWEQ